MATQNLKNINSHLTKSFDNEERIKALIKENLMVFIWLPPGYPKDSQPGFPGKIIQYYKNLGLKELEKATIGNLVGKYIITYAIKAGFVQKDSVLWIDGVPHAQIIMF